MSNQELRPTGFRILPPVIKNLIIINVLFFLATWSFDSALHINLEDLLGLHYPGSSKFYPYQFVTYMFMHGGFSHIFFNMFALWMFGNVLENLWGSKRFLIYYMITGIGAAVIQVLITWYQISAIQTAMDIYQSHPSPDAFGALMHKYFDGIYDPERLSTLINSWSIDPGNSFYFKESVEAVHKLITMKMDTPVIGASGAVFGLLLAFGMLFPNSLIYVYFAIPVKAKWFVIIYGVLELYGGVANRSGDNVAHFAHLGGMIFGYFLIIYWKRKMNRPNYL